MRFIVPLEEDAGLRSKVSYHFGRAPYLAVIDHSNGNISYEIRPNPASDSPRGGACGILDLLATFQAEAVIAKHLGVKAARRLLEAGVKVYEAASDTLGGVIEDIRSGSLRPLDLTALLAKPCPCLLYTSPSPRDRG